MSLDEPQVPTRFPPFLTAGTSFKVDRIFASYPTTEWKYTLLLAGAQVLQKDADADADGVTFHIVLTPANTQSLNPSGGDPLAYTFVERMTALDSSGEIWDVAAGRIMVNPNLAVAAAGDLVSHEETTLGIIEAALEGRLTADIENYSIAGRSVSKIPVRELIQLRGVYRRLVWKQRNPGKNSTPVDVTFPTLSYGPYPYTKRWTN